MDDLLEHVFREVIKFEWEIYRQYKLASKRTGRIADCVLQHHPVPESLLPDWQGNKLFKKIKRIRNRAWVDFQLFSPRDRFCQTITLPMEHFPLLRQCYLEAIVFKSKPQPLTLDYNYDSLVLYPKDNVIWLCFLPICLLPYTRFKIKESCQVDLIWHEYKGDQTWFGSAHLRLGETTVSFQHGILFQSSMGSNWLSIYPNVVHLGRSKDKKWCREFETILHKHWEATGHRSQT